MKTEDSEIEKYLDKVQSKRRNRAITLKFSEKETNLYYEVKELSKLVFDQNIVPELCRTVLVNALEKTKIDLENKMRSKTKSS